ncbi:hypothetical protein AMTR_s00069p00129640 [Amborella trichopoda]|uniref:Protein DETOXIFICATION n=1 Tax=Amborella trichopoda TaxID=13333 RepID=U5DD65_AMBTC|nr:hypothetical protein AMTR_s00069p00129640 [Amborella trichopoda]
MCRVSPTEKEDLLSPCKLIKNENETEILIPFIPQKKGSHEGSIKHKEEDKAFAQLHGWPTPKQALEELRQMGKISGPMVLTGLILYSKTMISMLFLGHLGELALAGGALAIGYANITGYSVLSGLAMGMEPICGQAFGAKRPHLLSLTLQRTILLLLSASLPISLLWLSMHTFLSLTGQDPDITSTAQTYILFSLPDLLSLAVLHPLRVYLRTQSITMPLTYCSLSAILLHIPINYLLINVMGLGVRGVALASCCTNLNILFSLSLYLYTSGLHKEAFGSLSLECFREWGSLLSLAIPSCVSTCLEWWWYEIMIILCGLLSNPSATVASMGILMQTTSLLYIFPSSLSFGVSTRVSNELGANRPQKAKHSTIVAIFCGFLLGFFALGFSLTVKNKWARLFSSDEEIWILTSRVLPIIGLCELGNCPQTIGCGVLRGTARPKVGANVNLGSFYFVGMPVAVGLGFFSGLGFGGLWMGLAAAQASCVGLMMVVIRRTDWGLMAERAMVLTGCHQNQDREKFCYTY